MSDEALIDAAFAAPEKQPVVEAPTTAVPVTDPSPVLATPEIIQAQPQQPRMVPLDALEDERRKRQEFERRVAEYEARNQPQQPQQEMSPEERQRNDIMNTHEEVARTRYGDEWVDAAKQWFTEQVMPNDPHLVAAIQNNPFPYRKLVETFHQEIERQRYQQLVSAGFDPRDPTGSIIKIADQLRAQQQPQADAPAEPPMQERPRAPNGQFAAAEAAPPQPQGQPAPPRSIASAPSAGKQSTPAAITEDQILAGAFGGR
jgi:hypothetical protein